MAGQWVARMVRFVLLSSIMVACLLQESSIGDPLEKGAIHFAFRPIAFTLESCETPERHAPETMAGGVAVFDYNNDGNLDIFFTNGADISSLRKDSPKYWNRLFRNNGDGSFTDVTEQAGLKGTGYDIGVAIGPQGLAIEVGRFIERLLYAPEGPRLALPARVVGEPVIGQFPGPAH